MFKYIVFLFVVTFAIVYGAPEAKPEPKAKPGILSAAYTAPIIAAPYAYAAPVAYPAGYVAAAPSVYAAGYRAYPAYTDYTAPLVVV